MCEEITRQEQEQQFEEELRKASTHYENESESSSTTSENHGIEELNDGKWDNDNDEDENEDFCRHCQKVMSYLRKSAVRWLYMEWYKKAVLGLHLPTISELTPTLANFLKEATQDQLEAHQQVLCGQCNTDLDKIIGRTLQPMSALSEMYSNLPPGEHHTSSLGRGRDRSISHQQLVQMRSHDIDTTISLADKDKENTPSAASFFLRAAQKLNLGANTTKQQKASKNNNKGMTNKNNAGKRGGDTVAIDNTRNIFLMNTSEMIMRTPPHAPPSLFKHGVTRRGDCHGKVRVILRTTNRRRGASDSCLTVDAKKKQVSLRESTITTTSNDGGQTSSSKRFDKAPRIYSFDNIFTQETTQQEICSGTLVDLLHTVVNGNDACMLTYGYPKLGKSSIMVGKDNSVDNIGVIPCAISWLYQLIDDRKQRTGARFSVRVSAVEVVGKSENLKDLLGEQGNGSMCSSNGGTSPSIYLPRERASSIQLSDFTELRAPNAEKAAFYFDAAVSSRTTPIPVVNENGEVIEDPDERRNSNMIFTLHVYQYMIDKVGTGEIHGGRSRFHLIDLSGCSRKKRSRDSGQGAWLPLSALGNVIVSIANGTKHIPHRDSKLTTLLREAMGSLSARITMIANVSQEPKHCFETLATFQMASRIHRSRKRKSRYSSGTSSSGGDSSCDERKKHRRRCKPVTPLLRTDTCQSDHHVESEFTSTSAAEESCDTVIYLGPGGRCLSDRDLTDFEHPPTMNKPTMRVSPVVNLNKTNHQNMTQNHQKVNTLPRANKDLQDKNTVETEKKVLPTKSKLSLRANNDPPIVVNVNSNSLTVKSPLEEIAPSAKLNQKQQNECCFGQQKTKDDFWVGHRKLNLPDNLKYSDSLPVRSKNRCYSVPESYDVNNNYKMTKKERRRTENDVGERLTRSTDSSPCKRGRSMTYDHSRIESNRSLSLDRTLLEKHEESEQICEENYRSNETISSIATVENFERQLVSKIAERFAVEAEFSLSKDNANDKNNNNNTSEDFYIDDDIDTISAGLDSRNPIDHYTIQTDYYNDSYGIDSNRIEEVVVRDNDVISCNTCIGECMCYHDSPFNNIQRHHFDSAEDTDEKTDKELRFSNSRHRNSFSSCDSHLNSPRNFDKHPPSEGVSSGYESMRCESSANIHSSDSSSEKGKSPRPKDSVNKTIYELDDEIRGINVKDEDKARFAKTSLFRAQIKELIGQRQDLKEELQQTLKRLVLNRVPLPDIDERLREISMQNRNTPQVLSRENRILERKVRVCKSHLELVSCLEANKQKPQKKRTNYQKLSAKLKAKLLKSPPITPSRKAYKVTSV
eukprot:TCONS_00071654-protein